MHDVTATVVKIGGPTLLIEIAGVRLLTDPTFDPAGSDYQVGPVSLRKTAGPAIDADSIGPIDAVLLSHDQHPDNLDERGRALLERVPIVVTTASGAERLGGAAIGLEAGETVRVGPVVVTATPAVHGPEHLLGVLGEVTGFLVEPGPGGPAVYVSGDNVDAACFAAAHDRADVRLAVVNGGAAKLEPFGPALLTASVEGIRVAAAALPEAQLLITHDSGWSHLTEDPHHVAALLKAELPRRLIEAEPGVTVEVDLAGAGGVTRRGAATHSGPTSRDARPAAAR
jgi:L-ascorbate metabolism protein UlaG (beta-lactamase superfamily)